MPSVETTALLADVIINGYAVSRCDLGLRVDNMNNGVGVAIFKQDGTLIETNMGDIELEFASSAMKSALKYMED